MPHALGFGSQGSAPADATEIHLADEEHLRDISKTFDVQATVINCRSGRLSVRCRSLPRPSLE